MQICNEKILGEFKKKSDPNKLNIAIFSDCYYPLIGGITTRVYNQAVELSKYANVMVVTGAVRGYKDDPDLPFCVLRSKGLKISDYQGHWALPALDRKFKKTLLSLNVDVIMLHTYFPIAKCAHWLKRKKHIPLVQVSHQRLYPEYLTIVHSKLIAKILTKYSVNHINKADVVWTVSQNVKDFYVKSGIVRDIEIDPSGTDKKAPENADELKADFCKKYGITDADNVLLCLGRVEAEQKNLYFLCDACKLALDKGCNFKLFFAGRGKDVETMKAYCQKIGLHNNATFLGFVPDDELNGLILRADLHLFPSRNDNFGLTKVETACLGTPTLATENTAVCENMTDGYNGYVSENDVNAYADKICAILADKDALAQVSANAQKTLSPTWEQTTKVTFEMLQNFLESRKQQR